MKKIYIFLLLAYFASSSVMVKGDDLQAYFSYSTFSSPDDGPYVETYLSVVGNSTRYTLTGDNQFQGQLDITITFEQEGKIEKFKKYSLLSPKVKDTTAIDFNFIDQQRFLLPNGSYDLTFKLIDHYGDTVPSIISKKVLIDFPLNMASVSDIQLVESVKKAEGTGILTKSGYDLIPYVDNFYPQNISVLTFYSEIYNTNITIGEGNKFITIYSIKSYETNQLVSRFIGSIRMEAAPVRSLLKSFDISKLPSGNYNLMVEVKDKNNEILAKSRVFFQRSNPTIQMDMSDISTVGVQNTFVEQYESVDTLREYIRSIRPISTQIEQGYTDHNLDEMTLKEMQQYFLNFWMTRNNLRPDKAWQDYKKRVEIANRLFNTITRKGYDTDRGRTYCRYGNPNTRAERYNMPNALPFEIWHYYSLDNQRNVKFVFYAKDDVTNDFIVLHSNLKGGVRNANWVRELKKLPYDVDRDITEDRNYYQDDIKGSWGSDIMRVWHDPY